MGEKSKIRFLIAVLCLCSCTNTSIGDKQTVYRLLFHNVPDIKCKEMHYTTHGIDLDGCTGVGKIRGATNVIESQE